MHRILPLIGMVAISNAPLAAQGSMRSLLARLPADARCTHTDTVTTDASGSTTLHLSQFKSDSTGRTVTVIVDGATGAALLAAYIGGSGVSGARVIGVLVTFSPRGKIVGAERVGQQTPFLVHDSTLARILFREMKRRCGISG
jgi:hypothetical protein